MITKTRVLTAAAALALLAGVPSEGAVSKFSVGWYSDYVAAFSAQGNSTAAYATAFSVDWQAGDPLPQSHSDPFVSFCLDINNTLGDGWWKSGTFSDVPLYPAPGSDNPIHRQQDSLYRVANLYQQYAPGILDSASGTWLNKLDGAALQLAIWEVLYEPYNLNTAYDVLTEGAAGQGFKVSSVNSAVSARANTMLASYSGPNFNLDTTFWNAVTDSSGRISRSSQDLVGPFTSIPEASTYVAAALLCIPVAVNGIRILRKRGS